MRVRGVRERREKDRKIVWGTEERKREKTERGKVGEPCREELRKREIRGEGAGKV